MTDSLAVFLSVFLVLLLGGLPVAWSMASSVLAWIAFRGQWHFLPVLPERIYQGMDVFVLMAIPLFILAGELISAGRITERLIHLANLWLGWLRGGLAMVNIGASILFSGITGVALGDIAALGRVFVPAMIEQGFSPAYAAAVTASSSIIGPMVPPSLIVIVYGSITDLSIGGLMAATVVPGLLIGAAQLTLVAVQARLRGFPAIAADRSPRALAAASGRALVPLMVPVIILAGILGGIMTPTESGAAAAFYALLLATLLYRTLRGRALYDAFARAMLFSGQLLIIVGCGAAFSFVMGIENVPAMLARAIAGWEVPSWITLLAFNAFLLFLGMFIDPTAAIILFGPILARAAAAAGIDPMHFAVVAILNLNIGLLTPPLGVCLFAAERIANCGLVPLLRATLPFLAVNLAVLALVSWVPAFSLWLPRVLGFR
jgi:C4-dicarboxylate transporter, DctM subunit